MNIRFVNSLPWDRNFDKEPGRALNLKWKRFVINCIVFYRNSFLLENGLMNKKTFSAIFLFRLVKGRFCWIFSMCIWAYTSWWSHSTPDYSPFITPSNPSISDIPNLLARYLWIAILDCLKTLHQMITWLGLLTKHDHPRWWLSLKLWLRGIM